MAKSTRLSVRIPDGILDRIKEMAEEACRSPSNQALFMITEWMKEHADVEKEN
ncbi:MAG: Arc family DNA-binding protein [Alphaproteobacteria bacterium]|nr:Arc family DNA-binding protein [Alphaproteobacteria bacterium]